MPSQKRFLIPLLLNFFIISLGVISLILQDTKIAALLILAAVFVNQAGGKFRKKHYADNFVKQLNSLVSLVSFGVAPAIIAWRIGLSNNIGTWKYIPLLFFVITGVYNLARHNSDDTWGSSIGLPIIAAGTLIALSVFFNPNVTFLSIFFIVLGLLMISKIKFKQV
jgi:CDP-diacylglycerol--serine O-phosphatidyltransferase